MGTSIIIKRIRFLWQAKGRHGTHSPFVYGFVNKVLRQKQSFPDIPKDWQQKDWDLLQATIKYLKPEVILVAASDKSPLKDNLRRLWPNIRFPSCSTAVNAGSDKNLMVFCDKEAVRLPKIDFEKFKKISLYMSTPHHQPPFHKMPSLLTKAGFKMKLDFWTASLWVKSCDFKEPQSFKLR